MRRFRRALLLLVAFAAIAFLGLWIAGPTPVSFGPYVQNVTTESAEICWFDEEPRRIQVVIRDRPVLAEESATSAHRVRIAGLGPDTTYEYDVRDPETGKSRGGGSFRTPPEDASRPFRFAVVGDSGKAPLWVRMHRFGWDRVHGLSPRTKQYDVAEWLAAKEPDFFVHLGDMIYHHNELPAYEGAFYLPFANVLRRAPIFAMFGNHDVYPFEEPAFFRLFRAGETIATKDRYGEYSHTFVWGGIRFLMLETFFHEWEEGSATRAWLLATLRDSPQPRTIVIMHTPAFSDERDIVENQNIQNNLWPVLVRHGVDLVIAGDSHSYQRFEPIDGVTQLIVGTGGKRIRPVERTARLAHVEEKFGFLLIEVRGARIEGSFCSAGDECLDRFTIGE